MPQGDGGLLRPIPKLIYCRK